MELKRKTSQVIKDWFSGDKKALLIKGARQVGKTYVIRSTLKELGNNYYEVNLIDSPEAIDILMNVKNVDELIMGLSTINDMPLIKGETVIFIDEVQKCKEMVTRIKFLVDEGSFKYILSGSLLGVELTNLESAPVGYLTTHEMFPLDFQEFLQITNITENVMAHLKKSFEDRTPVMDSIHEKLMTLFLQYLVVGGMPDAVSTFAETHNINAVLKIHKDIAELYKMDFTKYEAEDKRLQLINVYDLIPAELLKQNRRYIVSDIKKGLHFERVQSSFLWLNNAGVAYSVYNATEPRKPLKSSEKQSLFKLYLSDVGMLTSIYGMDTKRMLISKNPNMNAGGIFENAVAQELRSKGFSLYYYNSNRLGELDFVIEYKGSIYPIEVKSGKDYTVHSAISNCLANHQYEMQEAFVFADCNIKHDKKITYLPIYMVMFLEKDQSEDFIVDEVLF